MAQLPCKPDHADLHLNREVVNWRNNADDESYAPVTKAAPLQRLAETVNRCLGRYPQPWFTMGWPVSSEIAFKGDRLGTHPFINFGRHDQVPNARSGRIRITTAWRSVNSDKGDTAWATMAHNYQENSYQYEIWAEGDACSGPRTNYFYDSFYDEIRYSRGDETAAWREYGLNTYGGYQVLDMCAQDEELTQLEADSSVHDHCNVGQASSGESVLADLAESIRTSFHTIRKYNQGLQSCWAGCGSSNGWAYPSSTDANAIVVHSNTYVNLINQAWTSRNADSPGVPCKVWRTGVGHTGVESGQIVPVTVRVFAEYNAKGPAGAGSINVVSPNSTNYVNIAANTGALTGLGWADVNCVLNTMKNYDTWSDTKIDIFGKVQNTGDTLYVRGWVIHSDYN